MWVELESGGEQRSNKDCIRINKTLRYTGTQRRSLIFSFDSKVQSFARTLATLSDKILSV